MLYFITGVYGVGKSTVCNILSDSLGCPQFSASELISASVDEKYGTNKVVSDKEKNQYALIDAVQQLHTDHPDIILAGHFCILNRANQIENLPAFVYDILPISAIILLQADKDQIQANLQRRDGKEYDAQLICDFLERERDLAKATSDRLSKPLLIHDMKFDSDDVETIKSFILLISETKNKEIAEI